MFILSRVNADSLNTRIYNKVDYHPKLQNDLYNNIIVHKP